MHIPGKKKILNVLSPAIIIITGVLEYQSPPGVFLSWGYVFAIFLTIRTRNTPVLLLSGGLSVFFITMSFLYSADGPAGTVLMLNRAYAIAGLALASIIVYRSIIAENKAQGVRSKMEGIFSHGTQGIILVNDVGRISLLNPFVERMFGYPAGELIGNHIGVLIPGIDLAALLEGHAPMPNAADATARRKDGSSFPAEVSMNTYASAGDRHLVAFVNDITARRENEVKLQTKKQELEAVNKELEAFSYSVSHDLRAPLRAVGGYAKMLEEDHSDALDDEGRRLLSVIGTSAEQMGSLIDDLLSFSRLGKTEIKKTNVDMAELVQSTLFDIDKSTAHRAHITVGDLHPAMADSRLVTQVLTNVISNAIKYSSKKENPRIDIWSKRDGNQVLYTVRDNGAGFDMEYAANLFGVFERLHPSGEFEGTGVGLAIAQRIIKKHGGSISGEGKPGEGATFSFTLPAGSAGNDPNDLGDLAPEYSEIEARKERHT